MVARSASWLGFERRHVLRALAVGVSTLALSLVAAGLARANETVTSCGLDPNEVFDHAAVFGIATLEYCGNSTPYLAIQTRGNRVAAGQHATWQATAPPGLLIDTATVPSTSPDYVNDGNQYGGGVLLAGGGQQYYGANGDEGQLILGVANNTPGFPSPYFGFQLVCGANPCTTALPSVSVSQVILDVAETTAPTLLAGSCGPSTPPPPLRPDHQGSLESSALSTAGAPQTFNSASGQVPVSGIGQHTVSCNAFNNPVDAAGNVAESSTGTWSIKIGQPTVMGIAFFKLVACGALARVSVSRSPGE